MIGHVTVFASSTTSGTSSSTTALDRLLRSLDGSDLDVGIETPAGSYGPDNPPVTIRINSPRAVADILSAPGQLGLARAFIAGNLDIEGDITKLMGLRFSASTLARDPIGTLAIVREAGLRNLLARRTVQTEANPTGRRHSSRRDRAAVDYHYEAPTPFFELLLGPSMAYTCAVFNDPAQDLTSAQLEKYDLVRRKLRLSSSSRLLDIGCGWGAFALHAAETTGCHAVGVTLGTQQIEYARTQADKRGLASRVEFRQLDYREVTDGPYDAVVAMGSFEHIGLPRRGRTLFHHVNELIAPGGRFLNQAITSQKKAKMIASRRGFIHRYVFPDGELNEIGRTVTAIQAAGLEVRHVENLREHYILTADKWRANLENHWPAAVATGGEARARIWRLYLAAYRAQLVAGVIGICQTLAVRADDGRSGVDLREDYGPPPQRSQPDGT